MKNSLLLKLTCVAGFLATITLPQSVHAQSADALVDALVKKGILTVEEAKDLRQEADKGFAKAYSAKTGLPNWVESLKWGGDFRGRYDGVFQSSTDTTPGLIQSDRTRLRYRLRFGATAKLADEFEVGLRLGSGEVGAAALGAGGSTFSANTTLGNDATRKPIFVDLAYAKWTPKDWFQAEIGKMNGRFWMTDMVWDPDYNPEGAQQVLTYALNDRHKLHATLGEYVIAENYTAAANNNDAYLFMGQLDWTAKWTDRISSRLAIGGYSIKNQQDIGFDTAAATISGQKGTPASGAGSANFNPIVARGEVTYTFDSCPLFEGAFPVSLDAEYVNNPGAAHFAPAGTASGDQAYSFGGRLGSAKKKGNWELSYYFKEIGASAVWHGLNDDDFGWGASGGTDVRGHQAMLTYHPFDAMSLKIRYMRSERINNPVATKNDQDRLFVEALWSF